MDALTAASRSELMSRIRSTGNRSTEKAFATLLRAAHVSGWRRHQKLPGTPDFVFHMQRVVVFVDGCFWHKCPNCYRQPRTRKSFWVEKVQRNCSRDRRANKVLRAAGWRVVRIWECKLKKHPNQCVERIIKLIRPKSKTLHRRHKL